MSSNYVRVRLTGLAHEHFNDISHLLQNDHLTIRSRGHCIPSEVIDKKRPFKTEDIGTMVEIVAGHDAAVEDLVTNAVNQINSLYPNSATITTIIVRNNN